LFAGIPTLTYANNFYGTRLLEPMIAGYKTTIHLPGGAKLTTESTETEYHLNDHLRSTRLATAGDGAVSRGADYTPFGDTPADTAETANQYTGMNYEPETATYDYHARAYDPSVARFTAVDAIRESISPYSYVSNDPINKIDPDGLGEVYFYFSSERSWLMMSDPRKGLNMYRRVQNMKSIINSLNKAGVGNIKILSLEKRLPRPSLWEEDDETRHVTLNLPGPGDSKTVNVFDYLRDTDTIMSGAEFATHFEKILRNKAPAKEQFTRLINMKSILLEDSSLFLNEPVNELEEPFAYKFANRIKESLPKLEMVMATPYVIDDVELGANNELYINVLKSMRTTDFSVRDPMIKFKVNVTDYLTGNLPPSLFNPPSTENVHSVGLQTYNLSGDAIYHPHTSEHTPIKDFVIGAYGFTKPLFEKIPITRTKTPSVDIVPPRL